MRFDLTLIQPWIKPGARVLDLGCGDGTLLKTLGDEKQVSGLGLEIDPDNTIDEVDTDNNDRAISMSVESAPEEDTNSTLKMAALVVVGLVAGLAYVSYRSRR